MKSAIYALLVFATACGGTSATAQTMGAVPDSALLILVRAGDSSGAHDSIWIMDRQLDSILEVAKEVLNCEPTGVTDTAENRQFFIDKDELLNRLSTDKCYYVLATLIVVYAVIVGILSIQGNDRNERRALLSSKVVGFKRFRHARWLPTVGACLKVFFPVTQLSALLLCLPLNWEAIPWFTFPGLVAWLGVWVAFGSLYLLPRMLLILIKDQE